MLCLLCRLGDAGAGALAALIAEGAKLSSLQLCANDIGDDGMVALAQVQKHCSGSVRCTSLSLAAAAVVLVLTYCVM
jgi:hypothetical protein